MSRLSDQEIGKPMDEQEERLQSLAEDRVEKQERVNRIINDPNFDFRNQKLREQQNKIQELKALLETEKRKNERLNEIMSGVKIIRHYTGEIKCQ